jgi:AcrR family transcriptional regulator
MRKLAAACDVNVAALYYYFPSKAALFAAVVEERQYGSRIAAIPPVDLTLPVQDRIHQLFVAVWRGAMEEEPVWRLLLGEGLRSEPDALPVGSELLNTLPAGLAAWLAEAIPELTDPAVAADAFVAQLFSGFIRHILQPDVDVDELAAAHAQTLVAVLCDPMIDS